MCDDRYKDIDGLDLLEIRLMESFKHASFKRFVLMQICGSLLLLTTAWLVVGALR